MYWGWLGLMIWLSKINKTTLFIVYHFLFFLESPVGIQTLHTNEKEVNFIVVFAGSAILRRFLFSVSNPLVKCKDSFSFPLFLRQCSVARSIELRVGTCHSNPLEATARQNSLTRSKVSGGGRKCLQRGLSEANPHLTRISMTRDNAAGREHRSQPSHT